MKIIITLLLGCNCQRFVAGYCSAFACDFQTICIVCVSLSCSFLANENVLVYECKKTVRLCCQLHEHFEKERDRVNVLIDESREPASE